MKVSVTGVGTVTCAGNTLEEFWKNTIAENSGLNESGLGMISDSALESIRMQFPNSAGISKPVLIAIASIQEAMKEAGWQSLEKDDGLIIASTVGQIPFWEAELIRYLKKETDASEFSKSLTHQSLGSLAEVLANCLNFEGKSLLITSACSAATQAIGLASLWIEQGKVKRCLVGGSEVLSRLTGEGFKSLQLFSSQFAKPFDLNRQGINLSEGAAFFCLEKKTDRAIANITGTGFATDAYHMAAPHPEGRGSFEAMSAAIRMAELSPSDVNWIHAHGTGSKANDQSEGNAISQLFGRNGPHVSSTKWIHGHALGASGAIESALCVQAMKKQMILKTSGLSDPDPSIPIRHPRVHLPMELQHIVKNTLGFGGNNAALVISSPRSR